MAARAIGSATISFGLVSIPIKVYSSKVAENSVSFNMLEKETGARVKQQYVSSVTGDVVPRTEMIKGYEFAKGQFVTFTSEELKAFEVDANKSVEIAEFVPLEKVDPIFFETAYYVGPDKGAEKPYALLRDAMKKTGRAALAKYASRGKQYLVLVRPMEHGLVMQQLRYRDEIAMITELPLGDAEVTEPELKLAVQLIEQIAADDFVPDNYEDMVRKNIRTAIDQKIEGQEVTAAPTESPKARIIDLMEALRASLSESEVAAAADSATAADSAKRKPATPKRKPATKAPRKTAAKKRAAEN